MTEPLLCAEEAGLSYGNDTRPGITRKFKGKTPIFFDTKGKRIRDAATISRIKSLVIPPAWKNVWIATSKNLHLQATGIDSRGRKQYRYHNDWRKYRDTNKFENIIAFAKILPKVRKRVSRDLKKPGLSREKVLATIVRLLETSLIRVGNEEYAKSNKSFGLTTMQDRHADILGSKVYFHFRGKSGISHEIDLQSKAVAKIVKKCQDLPGQELFQYKDDDGNVHDVGSADVNNYLREISNAEITAKDFRTWAGTVLAAKTLLECEECDTVTGIKKNIVSAIKIVASKLGNTPAVCRKCYVHPILVEAYTAHALKLNYRQGKSGKGSRGLDSDEIAVLKFLQDKKNRKFKLPVKQPARNKAA